MKEIELTRGLVALVDDDDFERCSRHNWSANAAHNGFYATFGIWQTSKSGDQKFFRVYMHRFILGLPDGIEVDHVDNNKLNNQKSNLRICNRNQNAWNTGRSAMMCPKALPNGSFRAHINIDRKPKSLGTYPTEADALAVMDAAKVAIRGEFGRTSGRPIPEWAHETVKSILAGGPNPTTNQVFSDDAKASRIERRAAVRARYAAGGVLGREIATEFGISVPYVFQMLRNPFDGDDLQPVIDQYLKSNKGMNFRSLEKAAA